MDYVYPAYQSLKLDRPAEQVLRITMSRGKSMRWILSSTIR